MLRRKLQLTKALLTLVLFVIMALMGQQRLTVLATSASMRGTLVALDKSNSPSGPVMSASAISNDINGNNGNNNNNNNNNNDGGELFRPTNNDIAGYLRQAIRRVVTPGIGGLMGTGLSSSGGGGGGGSLAGDLGVALVAEGSSVSHKSLRNSPVSMRLPPRFGKRAPPYRVLVHSWLQSAPLSSSSSDSNAATDNNADNDDYYYNNNNNGPIWWPQSASRRPYLAPTQNLARGVPLSAIMAEYQQQQLLQQDY